MYNKIINGEGNERFEGTYDFNNFLDYVENNLGQDAKKAFQNIVTLEIPITPRLGKIGSTGTLEDFDYVVDFSKLQLDDPTKEKITNSYNTFYQDLQTTLSIRQSELEAKNKELSDMMMVWVEEHPLYISNFSESSALIL